MNGQAKLKVGAWTVSPALNVLERGERSIKLEPRTMDVLVYLASRAGEVVSVEELLAAVWKGVVVGDGSVYLAIKQLRQALAVPSDDTAYIETIPKRGYRLTVSVERIAASQNTATMTPANAPTGPALDAPSTLSPVTLLSSTRVAWLVASALAVGLAAALVPAARELLREPTQTTAILDLEVPGYVAGGLAVSPDGRFIAYTSASDGARRIWVRPLDAAARPLAGTEQAATVFWSPDSRNLAFTTDDGTLKRVDVESGLVQVLAEASMPGLAWGSGAWSRDGAILHGVQADTARHAPSGPRGNDAPAGFPIATMSAAGGALTPLTWPDVVNGETGHFVPRLLPDDEQFVYIGAGPHLPTAAIYLGSRAATTRTALVSIEDLVQANRRWNLAYADGYLLYSRGTALVAQRLDVAARALVGEPRTVAQDVDEFAVSTTGMLVYSEQASPVLPVPQQRRLSWFDRSGRRIGEIDARGAFAGPTLSPDGRRVAVAILAATPGVSDVTIVDAERGTGLPITVDDAGDGGAVWSRDGEKLAFSSGRGAIPFAPSAIYEQSAAGTGPQQLIFAGVAGEIISVTDWSTDVILFSRANKIGAKQVDIWALPMSGEQSAVALLTSPARKRGAKLSPDGRWIAYTTDESGHDEVVVQPYPALERGKWAISTRGGSSPRWRADGRELFYVASDSMLTAVAVPPSDGETFELGEARELFEVPLAGDAPVFDYEVAGNGEQFLVSEPVANPAVEDERPVRSLRVILNWTELLADE